MAHKKSRRMKHKASRKASRRVSRRRMTRRRMNGGVAPLTYSLSGDWASKMSMAQGGDFFKYHAGQHGGAAPVSNIGMSMLASGMEGPAMMSGLNRALAETAGMSDLPNQGGAPMAPQKVGGRRRKGKSSRRGKASRKANRKTNRRNNKRRGGALGFAPISAPGMLLSAGEYSQAGLNPGYRGAAVEYAVADARDKA